MAEAGGRRTTKKHQEPPHNYLHQRLTWNHLESQPSIPEPPLDHLDQGETNLLTSGPVEGLEQEQINGWFVGPH